MKIHKVKESSATKSLKSVKYGVVMSGDIGAGGKYSYENSVRNILEASNLNIIYYVEGIKRYAFFQSIFPIRFYREKFTDRVKKLIIGNLNSLPSCLTSKLFWSSLERKMTKDAVDIAYFVSPNHIGLIFQHIPMINTVWDLGHRDLPEYPEFRSLQTFRNRENYLALTLPRSLHIFVDSQTTLEKIHSFYGVEPYRISAVGLFPQIEIDSKKILQSAKKNIIVYPANFWPHKNHDTLFKAMRIVVKKYPCELYLTAASEMNVNEFTSRMNKEFPDVIFRCFVGINKLDLEEIIKYAKVLVMPSSLGPTNLPPLEAQLLGTKVVVSSAHKDLPSNSNIIKVDPFNESEFANAILNFLNEPEFDFKEVECSSNYPELLLETLNLVASRVR
jgi:glycosyltransferase involved in cell wall biosynthesis